MVDPLSYINLDNPPPNLEFSNIGQSQIIEIIKQFDNKTSPDLDGISVALLKKVAVQVSSPLAHIFNLSIQQGIFPNQLKVTRTVPVFKAGNPLSCDNYRPISLVKSFSKVLEKIVSINLVNHLELNKLIYRHQYGFQRGKSTEQNLLHVINNVGNALNDGMFCVGVFLDLKKAFDVCNHNILLKKMEKYGIVGTELEWFKSYLTGRSQVVDINGTHSTPRDIDISVIQGSILGPILFLIYINDLPNATNLLTFMFADDTSTLKSMTDLNELISFVNAELKKMATWFRCNKMAVNTSKTKFIIFRTRGKIINNDSVNILFNDNEPNTDDDPNLIYPLARVHDNNPDPNNRTYKLLGIYLDEYLSLNHHVSQICSKLSRALFLIKKARFILPPSAMKTLYTALFHSHLLYCTNIVSITSQTNINKILTVQKKAIRVITNSPYNAHTNPLFQQLRILPFPSLIKFRKLQFMHAVYNNYCNESFAGIWIKNEHRRIEHNLRNANDFLLPQLRIELFRKFPIYSFAYVWNSLGDLKLQPNPITFRISLEEEILNQLDDA
jgi:hypothetical protein